jgi:nicotinamidase-related amidase
MPANDDSDRRGVPSWKELVRLPEFPVDVGQTALVVIDMTKQQASRDHGVCKRLIADGYGDDLSYYLDRIENTTVPALVELTGSFRQLGAPVFYTRCASLRGDGSDQTWRHRSFGLVTSVDSEDSEILPPIAPQDGDILLTKTGSSVFTSTNFEHLLRNMGCSIVVVSGIFTNSCVEGTVRDAGDLDFRVLLAEDACAAMSPSGHAKALDYLDANFCHVRATAEIVTLLERSPSLGGLEVRT